jgi:hypothetical protein
VFSVGSLGKHHDTATEASSTNASIRTGDLREVDHGSRVRPNSICSLWRTPSCGARLPGAHLDQSGDRLEASTRLSAAVHRHHGNRRFGAAYLWPLSLLVSPRWSRSYFTARPSVVQTKTMVLQTVQFVVGGHTACAACLDGQSLAGHSITIRL